ncbi:hypothetical protein J4429_03320 [Candidatus Pacearchaeota archaeon]|nr:hypothetical protein [Candidatus Pacearchaeota archaeon]
MNKKEAVIELLKKHKEGLTVIEISRMLKISRNTSAVVLAELRGARLIWVRKVGMAKLNYWGNGRLKK